MSAELAGSQVSDGFIDSAWIDINGHMNVAYYVLIFDRSVDDLWGEFGITDDFINETRGSTFAVESHVTWQRELVENDPYLVTTQILAYDSKRIHQFQRLYHGSEHYLAATAEWMNLFIDLNSRKVGTWPDHILAAIERFSERQIDLRLPDEAGRQMRIRNPLAASPDY